MDAYQLTQDSMPKNIKKANLHPDEFYPYDHFSDKSFVRVPHSISRHEGFSMGAKMLYGVLLLCAPSGTAWPKQETLKKELGGASTRTIRRWLRELEELGLIRTKQKGRGLPNNYYFLKSHIIGNAPDPTPTDKYPTEEAEEYKEEIIGLDEPDQRCFDTKAEFMEAVNNWQRIVFGPEWIQEQDEWVQQDQESRLKEATTHMIYDEPLPKFRDFSSKEAYARAYYNWELEVYNPSFLYKKYGKEALLKFHGVEASESSLVRCFQSEYYE